MKNERKKILVVDDEKDLCRILSNLFTSEGGYQVLTAYDGETAMRAAIRERPDLILLDIVMPGMTGGELAEELQDNPVTASIPIIFMSALVTENEVQNIGYCTGGRMICAKPLVMEELLKHIETVLIKGN
ncbi:response regulator [Desulfonatronovibrio magnus]|uniref:response regulator n=1 Tax=Desulfonatronovibrio magnus TaxID=698827 RepID=UPI0006982B8D|nr:response regulator [Desulfonatronovibrio magnus]